MSADSQHKPDKETHPQHKSHRRRRRILGIVSRSLSSGGWIALLNFLWIDYRLDGVVLSIMAIMLAPVAEAFAIQLSNKHKVLMVFSWTLSEIGWLCFSYFLWLAPNVIGLATSLIVIFSGDMMDATLY